MIDTKKTVEIKNLTGGLWNRFCDARMSFPVPLHESDLTKPFIYDRAYGVFYVAFGHHQVAMHTLLAIHGVEIDDISSGADMFIEEIPGTAFRSSVGKCIITWSLKNLNAIERRIMTATDELMEVGNDN